MHCGKVEATRIILHDMLEMLQKAVKNLDEAREYRPTPSTSMLRGQDSSGGRRVRPPGNDAPTLAESGITYDQSSQAQRLAEIADEQPERNEVMRGLRARGMTLQAVADAVGVSHQTVMRAADGVNVQTDIENARGQSRPTHYASRAGADEEVKEQIHPHVANNSGDNEWYTPMPYAEATRASLDESKALWTLTSKQDVIQCDVIYRAYY